MGILVATPAKHTPGSVTYLTDQQSLQESGKTDNCGTGKANYFHFVTLIMKDFLIQFLLSVSYCTGSVHSDFTVM